MGSVVECDFDCVNLHDIEIGWEDGAVGVVCLCLAGIVGGVFFPEGQVLGNNKRVMAVFEEVDGDGKESEYEVLESNMGRCIYPAYKIVIADIK